MFGVDLSFTRLDGASLQNVKLDGGNLISASCVGVDFSHSNAQRVALEGADLTDTSWEGVDLTDARPLSDAFLLNVASSNVTLDDVVSGRLGDLLEAERIVEEKRAEEERLRRLEEHRLVVGDMLPTFSEIGPCKFDMGARKVGYRDERPRHKVSISYPFSIAAIPVTQDLYEVVMGENPSQFTGDEHGEHPVESVNWIDAARFCNTISELLGLTPAYQITLIDPLPSIDQDNEAGESNLK